MYEEKKDLMRDLAKLQWELESARKKLDLILEGLNDN